MELSIKTSELQSMVGKAIKCVSNNKLIPLTSLMNIKVSNNLLTLTTTDATNYFYVGSNEKLDCEDFEVSVIADTFTKLVQKTTSDNIEIKIEGSIMTVSGNGKYTMELPLDENGSVIKFPVKIRTEITPEDGGCIKLSTVKNIIAVNKAALADNMEAPILTCYYCGDSVITSDKKKICKNDIKTFNKPMALTPTMVELLACMNDENISLALYGSDCVFTSGNDKVYAPIVEGVDTFPVKAINGLVDQEFESVCKVSRAAVLNLLDRLSLFVVPYDKQGIYLTFNNEGIMFSSKKSSGQELIPYIESSNFKPYTCCINIEMLRSQIACQDSENIELYYGSKIAVKMVNNKVTQIVALLVDDRMEG